MAINLTEKNLHFSLRDRNGFPANRILVVCNIAAEPFLILERIWQCVAINCVLSFIRRQIYHYSCNNERKKNIHSYRTSPRTASEDAFLIQAIYNSQNQKPDDLCCCISVSIISTNKCRLRVHSGRCHRAVG